MAEIWMISPYASPSVYGWHSRTYIMSKDLKNRGHQVTVFSFTGSHYLHLKDAKTLKTNTEVHEGVVFKWFKSILFKKDNFLVRILNWQLYNIQLKKYFINYKGQKPDSIVFSTPSLSHARLIPLVKKLFPDAKIIFEIRDIWPLSIAYLGGFSKNNFIIKRLKSAEKIAVKLSDAIIAVQPGIQRYFRDFFPDVAPQKIHFIPHAYSPIDYSLSEIEYEFGYAGTLSRANDVQTLLQALYILKDKYNLEPKVLIIGTGLYVHFLKEEAKNLKNVHFLPWIDRQAALKELLKCRVGYDGFLNLDLYKYGFSRLKWVDYMLLKKPILASYSGAPIDVEIDSIGWQSAAENPQELSELLFQILNKSATDVAEKGQMGFEFLQKERHISKLGAQYEAIL